MCLHVGPRLRMHGAVPPLPSSPAWCIAQLNTGVTSPLLCSLTEWCSGQHTCFIFWWSPDQISVGIQFVFTEDLPVSSALPGRSKPCMLCSPDTLNPVFLIGLQFLLCYTTSVPDTILLNLCLFTSFAAEMFTGVWPAADSQFTYLFLLCGFFPEVIDTE